MGKELFIKAIKKQIKYSPCISVFSVFSVVKRYFDRLTASLPFCLTAEMHREMKRNKDAGLFFTCYYEYFPDIFIKPTRTNQIISFMNKKQIKYSPCISVFSVFSVVKRYFDRLTASLPFCLTAEMHREMKRNKDAGLFFTYYYEYFSDIFIKPTMQYI